MKTTNTVPCRCRAFKYSPVFEENVCVLCHGAGFHVHCPFCEKEVGAGGVGGDGCYAMVIANYFRERGEDDEWAGVEDTEEYARLADRCLKGYDCGCVED